ncbi:MAG: hypothetical protein KY469_18050 [Actinobacteria bacterium]|nr:hypothetical protein [Actinomycetota bacterium]
MRWSLVIVVALTAVACGGGGEPAPSVVEGSGEVPRCEDLEPIELPSEHLRDEPVYVGNEQPVEELSAWAQSRPGFEELWIDRNHLGWVVLAFSEDAEARQAELAERFPDVGAVVVAVDWTMAELEVLQQRVHEGVDLESYTSGVDITRGVVEVGVGALTDANIAAVADRFAGERVCVSGSDPASVPEEGPQPQAGEGWRLLADEPVGEPYRTWIAADQDAYARLWSEIGLSGEPPEVAFDGEVVIWFGAVYSGSCPRIRLDDVVIDHDRALVHAEIVELGAEPACTDDANPRAYVVAVERSVLPSGPFAIQLGPEDPPGGAFEERTLIEVDLTERGSAPAPDEIGPDPAAAEPQPTTVGPGEIIETGYPALYRFWLHCGPEWLGPLNDVMWRSDVTQIPPEWRERMHDSEELVVEVLIETDPATLTATAGDHTIVYRPSPEDPPGCD